MLRRVYWNAIVKLVWQCRWRSHTTGGLYCPLMKLSCWTGWQAIADKEAPAAVAFSPDNYQYGTGVHAESVRVLAVCPISFSKFLQIICFHQQCLSIDAVWSDHWFFIQCNQRSLMYYATNIKSMALEHSGVIRSRYIYIGLCTVYGL